mmetsp:Transcript_29049/g.34258  ORF Transcript_29049/g.34258 Transcript_29049/m.34258 type:complete len:709 (+) Transcript_29049:149-2275(+)
MSNNLEEDPPPSFYCPISQQIMHDPVVLSDGYSYERRHLQQWLEHKDSSPISGVKLPSKEFFENTTLKTGIEEYFKQMFTIHRNRIRKAAVSGTGDSKLPSLNRTSSTGSTRSVEDDTPLLNLNTPRGGLSSNEYLARTVDSLMELALLVSSDKSSEDILRSIVDEAKELIGAETASVFLIDFEKHELVSTINSTDGEIHLPLSCGIAGMVATTGQSVIIHNAYNHEQFYNKIDQQTGFRTHNILCVPIKTKKGVVIGVAQLINKLGDPDQILDSASSEHEECFSEGDERFLYVFASQAAAAIAGNTMSDIRSPDQVTSSSAGTGNSSSGAHNRHFLKAGVPSHSFEDSLSSESIEILNESLSIWQTDVIHLSKITSSRPLSSLMCFLFQKLNFIKQFDMDFNRVRTFFINIEAGYVEENSYHNKDHAASVAHMTYAMLKLGGIGDAVSSGQWFLPPPPSPPTEPSSPGRIPLGRSCHDIVMMSGLVAAAIHDFEHLGVTNSFLIKSNHSRAVLYNDIHVNEHHHVAAACRVLQLPECNFLAQLGSDETRQIRKMLIDFVLATDMDDDKRLRNLFQEALDKRLVGGINEFVPGTKEEAILTLQMTLKSADLGHLALPWDSHVNWVERLENEFFAQGDKESALGLSPISFLMDRTQPGVTQTQIGFFEFVAIPLFTCMEQAFPKIAPMVAAIAENAESWRLVTEYYPVN